LSEAPRGRLDRINWGAFFFGWLWAAAHGLWLWFAILGLLDLLATVFFASLYATLVGRSPLALVALSAASAMAGAVLLAVFAFRANQLYLDRHPGAESLRRFATSQRLWAGIGLAFWILGLASGAYATARGAQALMAPRAIGTAVDVLAVLVIWLYDRYRRRG
jgi:hypothetical protein